MTTGTPNARNCRPFERARKLVGLDPDKTDHAAASGANTLSDGADIDDGVALVASFDLDIDVGAEHAVACTLRDQPVNARQAV